MATSAAIGHGTVFALGDGGTPEVFTALAECTGLTGPNVSRDLVDATHFASPEKWREFVPGLRDAGEISATLNFVPGGPAQDLIFAEFLSEVIGNYRLTWPNGDIWNFSGFCTGFAPEDPLDAKMVVTATFKLSGKPTFFTA